MIELKNNILKVNISRDKGSQLSNIIKNNKEYIWQKDAYYFDASSPLLFPIIGRLKDNKYIYDNKEYSLNIHGFCSSGLKNLDLIEHTSSKALFELMYNEFSLNLYPFKFKLHIIYELIKNTVQITYRVYNLDDKKIYFQIGAHTAFNCPLDNNKFDDYYLEFEKEENLNTFRLNEKGLILDDKEFIKNGKEINLDYSLFDKDALIFTNLNSSYVCLKSKKNNSQIKCNFSNFPYLAFWTQREDNKKGKFICIEPWSGIADYHDSNYILKNKKAINTLDIDKVYENSYSLEFID